jgi:hypothetical protein
MRRKHIIGTLLVVVLLVSFATTYAVTWTLRASWTNLFVSYHRMYCTTLPYYTAPYHWVRLRPLNNDVDLYVYGMRGDPLSASWVRIGYSRLGGLNWENVRFSSAVRTYYNTAIIACAYGYSGSSYYHQYYYTGV